MSAEEVLAAFRRDAPNLFLGAAFAARHGVAAFAVLRRLTTRPQVLHEDAFLFLSDKLPAMALNQRNHRG